VKSRLADLFSHTFKSEGAAKDHRLRSRGAGIQQFGRLPCPRARSGRTRARRSQGRLRSFHRPAVWVNRSGIIKSFVRRGFAGRSRCLVDGGDQSPRSPDPAVAGGSPGRIRVICSSHAIKPFAVDSSKIHFDDRPKFRSIHDDRHLAAIQSPDRVGDWRVQCFQAICHRRAPVREGTTAVLPRTKDRFISRPTSSR
jgi:hypothetical protein